MIKGEGVDFERVTSLDGTFIANRYAPGDTENYMQHRRDRQRLDAFADELDEEYGWTEADMIAEEARKAGNSRMGANANAMNAKQASADQ